MPNRDAVVGEEVLRIPTIVGLITDEVAGIGSVVVDLDMQTSCDLMNCYSETADLDVN